MGPGLLESVYRDCLAHELSSLGLSVTTEVSLDLVYKDLLLPDSYRIDLLVEDRVVIEIKAVDRVLPVHEAQLLTYLKLSGLKTGLLLNFKVKMLKDGILRRVL